MSRGELFGAQHITRTSLRKHFSLIAYAQMPCFLGSRAQVVKPMRESHVIVAEKKHTRAVRIFANGAQVRCAKRLRCDLDSFS
jgi:hypothetical protein